MKGKIILSMILGFGAISLSHQASAGWVSGPCPQPHTGPAPCIESITAADGTWHFNGSGGHADDWHGAPGGGNLSFSGPAFLGCDDLDLDCTLTLTGQVKKCQDSNGDWRIGIRAMSFNVAGAFPCGTVVLNEFPWYSKDPAIAQHCPFEDVCDNFNPYVPGTNPYLFNMGLIDITVFFVPRVNDGHVHLAEFHHGANTRFVFNSEFYDCDENELGCYVDGVVHYNGGNGDVINVY